MRLKSLIGVFVAGVWALGCSSKAEESEEFGMLSMNLRTVSAQEQVYRLRDASFVVLDDELEVGSLDSEDDPDSDRLTLELAPGDYQLGLLPGFRLEHIEGDSVEDVAFELLDERVRNIEVVSEQTVTVSYRFQILDEDNEDGDGGGGDVAVVGGDVEVTIEVIDAPGLDAGLGDLPVDVPVDAAPLALVTFDQVQPIFAAKCSPCHTAGGSGGHNVGAIDLAEAFADSQLDAFSIVGTKGEATLARLEAGTMPPGIDCVTDPENPACFNEGELALLRTWIDDGQLAPAD